MHPQRKQRTPAEQAEADRRDRRQFWIIAAVFTVALVGLTGLYVAVSTNVEPPTPDRSAVQEDNQTALPVPDGGAEPTESGDRGGVGQLAVLGGILVVFGGGAAWLVHSSRRARRRHEREHRSTSGDTGDGTGPSRAEPAPSGPTPARTDPVG